MTTPIRRNCNTVCLGGNPCNCTGPHTMHACKRPGCICHTTYLQRVMAWAERLSADPYALNKVMEVVTKWESKSHGNNGKGQSTEPTRPAATADNAS